MFFSQTMHLLLHACSVSLLPLLLVLLLLMLLLLLPNAAGWERELFTATTFLADAEQEPATHPINKARAIVAMSLLDCVSVVLYFAATLLIIWRARKLAHDADMHTVRVMTNDVTNSLLLCRPANAQEGCVCTAAAL
jgi:hypothetical protein